MSSIQVIAELAVPLLAILGLNEFLNTKGDKTEKLKAFKWAGISVAGLALLFTAAGANMFAFESFRDGNYENMLAGLSDVLIEDRRTIFFQDSLRSLIYVVITGCLLWLFLTDKIKKNIVIGGILILVLMDLVMVDKRYVNNDDFISKSRLEKPFELSPLQAEILKDKSHFRVMNFMVDPLNDGSTSFYHNSVGGYHAAKPRRFQELYEFQIARNNIEVLNMLNTKYFIFPGENNQENVQLNEEANGNAWFVHDVIFVDTADEEIKALDSLQSKEMVILSRDYKADLENFRFQKDSTASIALSSYKPNEMKYKTTSQTQQLAVFSEMYYAAGWNAYLDGEKISHMRANYVLRAALIPEGNHELIFKFEPKVIETGSLISLISYGLLLLIPLGWYFKERKDKADS